MTHAKLQPLLALINKRQTKPLLLVAIDGHSASGKSTLANTLAALLPHVTIVHTDDFYRPTAEVERFALTAEAGYQRYYDWERLAAQVLKPLSAGRQSCYHRYDWSTNQLGAWVTLPTTGIMLVEGCYAARPELKAYYDLIVLVETSAAQRLQRQQARADATPAWLARWDAAERFYLSHAQPQLYADLVITGE